jgi:phosphoribosylaminoimidazole-succinocarboxamide synthase
MAALSKQTIQAALASTLEGTDFPSLGRKYEGKVRDSYISGDRRVIIVTDRVSAFDRIVGTLPLKGQLLNRITQFWFEQTRHLVPNHLIVSPDPNAMLVHECQPLPVEMVVRAYLTGSTSTSIWVHYEQGARKFCGHRLPDGLKRNQRLSEPILTPSTKAPQGAHDVSGSRAEILEWTGMNPAEFDTAADMAMALFRFGQKLCLERGLILVDTKYEFGKTRDGRIVVIDEVHTPDSSRFWFAESYERRFAASEDPESFDKEYVRRWLKERGFVGEGPIPELPEAVRVEATARYAETVQTLLGRSFEPNLEQPLPRLTRNLKIPVES